MYVQMLGEVQLFPLVMAWESFSNSADAHGGAPDPLPGVDGQVGGLLARR